MPNYDHKEGKSVVTIILDFGLVYFKAQCKLYIFYIHVGTYKSIYMWMNILVEYIYIYLYTQRYMHICGYINIFFHSINAVKPVMLLFSNFIGGEAIKIYIYHFKTLHIILIYMYIKKMI